jgi:hypothetical protein
MCPDDATVLCPSLTAHSTVTKFEVPALLSAFHFGVRKSAASSTMLAAFRQRLWCAWTSGDDPLFKATATVVLGYLGPDSMAMANLQGELSASSPNDVALAKAGLLLMGQTSYDADVRACSDSSTLDKYVVGACAAAMGIADKADCMVTNVLMPNSLRWADPNDPYSTLGLQAIYYSHLLMLVAEDRRQWVPKGLESGTVSFYGE